MYHRIVLQKVIQIAEVSKFDKNTAEYIIKAIFSMIKHKIEKISPVEYASLCVH